MKKMTVFLEKFRQWIAPPSSLEDDGEPLAEGEDPFAEPVIWEITDTIDLHGVAPREVKAVVEAYLEAAYAKGFGRVRIIHGKGKGVQRKAVRQILAHTVFVQEFYDATDGSGWGATVTVFSGLEKRGALAEGNRL